MPLSNLIMKPKTHPLGNSLRRTIVKALRHQTDGSKFELNQTHCIREMFLRGVTLQTNIPDVTSTMIKHNTHPPTHKNPPM